MADSNEDPNLLHPQGEVEGQYDPSLAYAVSPSLSRLSPFDIGRLDVLGLHGSSSELALSKEGSLRFVCYARRGQEEGLEGMRWSFSLSPSHVFFTTRPFQKRKNIYMLVSLLLPLLDILLIFVRSFSPSVLAATTDNGPLPSPGRPFPPTLRRLP
jgi:hypothetical protein